VIVVVVVGVVEVVIADDWSCVAPILSAASLRTSSRLWIPRMSDSTTGRTKRW